MPDINDINKEEDEFNIKELYLLIWFKKFFILKVIGISTLLSIVLALLIQNTYTSKALLAPANLDESLSSKLGEFSSLSSLSGIGLPGEIADPTIEAVERIKSYDFFENYFLPRIELQNLFAVKKWHHEDNSLQYDNNIYNKELNKWVRKVRFPQKVIPSPQESYEVFIDILKVSQDRKTSFVSISIDHKSPYIAKKWLDIIVNNINESMREEDKAIASNAIIFLNESSLTTNNNQLKEAIATLLEDQMQDLMLASAHKDYIFKTIDSPLAPEEKSSPNRILIILFGIFFGTIFSFVIIAFNHFKVIFKKNLSSIDFSKK